MYVCKSVSELEVPIGLGVLQVLKLRNGLLLEECIRIPIPIVKLLIPIVELLIPIVKLLIPIVELGQCC